MGGRARGAGQPGDDVARPDAAGAAAQKKSLVAAERDEAARQAWRAEVAALDPARLVFLDETATPTSLWQSVTLLASSDARGMGAAMVLDGAVNRAAFDAYVEQLLLPTLAPGQVVVLDNLAVHKRPRARALIEGAGCALRFLPPYSPDFNPIEPAFAKIKQRLRGEAPRSFAGIVAATGPALDAVTAADARGFFTHCGYRLPGQLL